MASRPVRRPGARPQTLLPLSAGSASNSLSCWYCDFKIYTLNKILFSFGRRHARLLQVWFTVGVAFSFMALLGVTMILFCESVGVLHLYSGTVEHNNLLTWLFGMFPLAHGFHISMLDAGVMILSTLFSVSVHEFGHAIAAASEGVQIEYIAIFLAVIFPGALVAFNYDLLQSLPYFSALRIYSGGIWHNIMLCGVCWLTTVLLPLILYPICIHDGSPMVLEVPRTSPLSGYLSCNDVILSVDGSNIDYPHQWMEKLNHIHTQMLHETVSNRKGYCVPNSLVETSKKSQAAEIQFSCLDEFAVFLRISCSNSSLLVGNSSSGSDESKSDIKVCLMAKDVVKHKKCGDGWQIPGTHSCACSKEESCMAPVQIPGISWVEISYSSPYSLECLQQGKNLTVADSGSTPCGGTFVFVGDVLSLVHSVQLSAYRPRWSSIVSISWLPFLLEKVLTCNFHLSMTLALLNSLPVYFLDGEAILDMGLCCITWINTRKRRKIRRFCLIGGTIVTIIGFSKILYPTLALGRYVRSTRKDFEQVATIAVELIGIPGWTNSA